METRKSRASAVKALLRETAQEKRPVSPLRRRMIRDMELAGFAPGTKHTYLAAVVALQKHTGTRPDKLSEKQVFDYLLWLRDVKSVPKGTFKTTLYGLKFFYHRCLGLDWALFTRKRIRFPRQKRMPVPVSWDDGQRLIGAIRKPAYRLCCTLMLSLGLRIGDTLGLTVEAIDSRNGLVRIVGKGSKERALPLSETLLTALREFWRTHRHPRLLFPNQRRTGPLDEGSFRQAFRDARDRIGLGKNVTPHSLRHGFATHLLQEGVDVRVVQMLMGHASIRSTQVYTHLTVPMQDDLRDRLDAMFSALLPGGRDHG